MIRARRKVILGQVVDLKERGQKSSPLASCKGIGPTRAFSQRNGGFLVRVAAPGVARLPRWAWQPPGQLPSLLGKREADCHV
jgi:hypothetical protein